MRVAYLSSKGENVMKKYIAAGLVIALLCSMTVQAKRAYIEPMVGNPFKEPCKIRCTCYCEHGTTGTGKKTRYGIVAGRKEWIGYTAELNAVNEDGSVGEFIGFFEFQDTGAGMDSDGDGIGDTIKNGQSIDVWINSLSEAYAWRDRYGDYVYIKIFRAKG